MEILLGIAIYFAPTIIALLRKRPRPGGVIAVNLFLGWTLIGWVVALVMAFHEPKPKGGASSYQDSVVPPEGAIVAESVLGIMWFDGSEVTIKRKGTLSLVTHGLDGVKHIGIGAIQAVQLRGAKYGVRGYLQLSVLGAMESTRGAIAAAGDENSLLFDVNDQPQFETLSKAIRAAVASRHAPAAPQRASGAAELAKLAELRDQGILTEDEFQAEKAKVLA